MHRNYKECKIIWWQNVYKNGQWMIHLSWPVLSPTLQWYIIICVMRLLPASLSLLAAYWSLSWLTKLPASLSYYQHCYQHTVMKNNIATSITAWLRTLLPALLPWLLPASLPSQPTLLQWPLPTYASGSEQLLSLRLLLLSFSELVALLALPCKS